MKSNGGDAQGKIAGTGKSKRNTGSGGAKMSIAWVIKITLWTILISVVLTLLTSNTLNNVGYVLAFALLAGFILFGVTFDAVGVAVTAAEEKPFHSMAARKVPGANEAIGLIRNAEKVSNVCSDVLGDVAGIISGTTAAIIVDNLATGFDLDQLVLQIILSGLVTGLTIGGKAIGKWVAINGSTRIVLFVGKLLYLLGSLKGRLKMSEKGS